MAYNNSYGNFAGQYQNQCLPNITGGVNSAFQGKNWNTSTYGAIRLQSHRGDNSWKENTNGHTGFYFDASLSNKIYRNNCKQVQSYTYFVYMWVRTS